MARLSPVPRGARLGDLPALLDRAPRIDPAAALAHGLTLATGNVREFDRVPGLKVEAWR